MTKIYGHRGSMGTFPENSLIGFLNAVEDGVDGLELDVHLTKDGEVVVIHDESIDRTTDGSGLIKDLTMEEISQFSTGNRFSHLASFTNEWRAEKVPTLQEVLELLEPYDTELNIELKTYIEPYVGLEERVNDIVANYGNGRKIVYSSFHLPTLVNMKRINPQANIAWLLNHPVSRPDDYLEAFELESLHVSSKVAFQQAKKWQEILPLLRVWTVNESNDIKQLLDLRVGAIITDYPEKAIFYRSERRSFIG
ncbi:glycerophosphodiester phosphodiesterase [Oceanobacillus kapialis]|uniref:glycerophosphodiester phosphodiesterase n=1 Tax=Oceanobacillus kapialis TaxID=481353 RepID=UPI00384D96C9